MSLINKMFNMIGIEFGGEEEEFDEEFLDDAKQAESKAPIPAFDDDYAEFGGKKNKVVKIHTTAQLKLVVIQPETFEEAKDIAIHLKSKKPVVMNLEMVDRDVQRRIVDFLSGAVYALDGNMLDECSVTVGQKSEIKLEDVSTDTLKYGEKIILHVNTSGLPDGATVKWTTSISSILKISNENAECSTH